MAIIAKSYSMEQDFAFFVVNFGYTKQDYNALTEAEKMFIYKAYESKLVSEMTHMRNAVLNAVNNAMRKKGKKFQDLFKKKQAKVDVEYNTNAVATILEVEEKEGKSWVDKIYSESGLKRPQRKEGE